MIKVLKRGFFFIFPFLIINLIYLFSSGFAFADEPISEWSSTTTLPYLLTSQPSLSFSNKVFTFGGSASTGNSHYEVLSATINSTGTLSSWETTSAPLPSALIWHSGAAKENNFYILGGREENSGSSMSSVDKVYLGTVSEGIIPSWQELTPLPKKLQLGAAAIVGDRIYYAGGYTDAASNTNQTVYFSSINPDGTIGSWQIAGLLPDPLWALGMVENGNSLIVVGGTGDEGYSSKAYVSQINSDGTLAGWEETSSLPEPSYRAGVVRVGSKIFSIGGYAGNKVYYTDIKSDGKLDSWVLSANLLPHWVGGTSVAVSNKHMYVIGGFDGSNYLDSVYYAKINNGDMDLDVSLLKQTSEPWQGNIYDRANIWHPSDPTIHRWGCALTSATMVLNFHGYNKLPDSTVLDPGTLNIWLKNQIDGYVGNGSMNWLAISRLSKLAKEINGITLFDALEYTRIKGENKTKLKEDIENSMPDILGVPGHFFVAKGINGETFNINDPYYDYLTLEEGYANTFTSLGNYKPSSTDLSYIMFVVDKDIQILLKDELGNQVGEEFLEEQLTDPIDGIPSGPPIKILYFKKPDTQDYKLFISSLNPKQYNIEIYLYDINGEVNKTETKGVTGGVSDILTLKFDKDKLEDSETQKFVTFQSTIADINELQKLKLIRSKDVAKELIDILKSAEKSAIKGNKKIALAKLKIFEILLNKTRGMIIKENAYQILLYDLNFLKESLK